MVYHPSADVVGLASAARVGPDTSDQCRELRKNHEFSFTFGHANQERNVKLTGCRDHPLKDNQVGKLEVPVLLAAQQHLRGSYAGTA